MLRDKHNKKNPTQPNPVFPNWVYDRPALLGDFITSPTPPGDPAVAIGELISYSSLLCAVILSSASWVTWWNLLCWCINCVLHQMTVFVIVPVLRYDAPGCSGTSSGRRSAVCPGWSWWAWHHSSACPGEAEPLLHRWFNTGHVCQRAGEQNIASGVVLLHYNTVRM